MQCIFPALELELPKKNEKHTIFIVFLFIFHKKRFFGHGGVFFQANAPKLIETMVIIIN